MASITLADGGLIATHLQADATDEGIRWRVTVRREGTPIARTDVTTQGPSGRFELQPA